MGRKTHPNNGRRNRPIASLIRWYSDKQSNKVSDARQEIKRRFSGLDWSQQKKVLRAFVEGSNEDRRWSLRKMYLMWDDSFADIVARHWSQSHDNDCALVVAKHMPEAYLLEHVAELDELPYWLACQRLALHRVFVIDRSKVPPADYLWLANEYRPDEFPSSDECLDILFGLVHDCCTSLDQLPQVEAFIHDELFAGPMNMEEVAHAYWLIRRHRPDAASAFELWCQQVNHAIEMSEEHELMTCRLDVDNELFWYNEENVHIACKYAYLLLDDKYKKPDDPSVRDILELRRPHWTHCPERIRFDMSMAPVYIKHTSSEQRDVQQQVEQTLDMPMEVVNLKNSRR